MKNERDFSVGIEEYYRTEDYNRLFHYFFEVYLAAFTKGLASDEFLLASRRPPRLDIDPDGAVAAYLEQGLYLLRHGYAPTVLLLFLEHLAVEYTHKDSLKEQIHMMNLSGYLIQALQVRDLDVLIDMDRLWSADTHNDAAGFFYPRLPQEIREKYFLTDCTPAR